MGHARSSQDYVRLGPHRVVLEPHKAMLEPRRAVFEPHRAFFLAQTFVTASQDRETSAHGYVMARQGSIKKHSPAHA